MLTKITDVSGCVASVVDKARALLWVAEAKTSTLSSVDLATGVKTAHYLPPTAPTGLALSNDGNELLAAATDRHLVSFNAANPDAGPTRILLTTVGGIGQIAAT